MKQEIIDQFIANMNKLNEEIVKISSPTLQTITWLNNFDKLLNPVWKDGYDEGVKEGKRQEKEKVRIIKSN